MGYFDALANSSFKKDSGGRWLFFPHGVLGRGYIIESEQDYQTLRRRFLAFIVPSLVLIVGAVLLLGILGGVVVGLLYMLVHLLWTRSQVRGLEPSAERLSWNETMTAQVPRITPSSCGSD